MLSSRDCATVLYCGVGSVGAQRSLMLMTVSFGIAMTDLLVLKEGVTVVMPDHKPLLAVGFFFGE